MGRAGDGAHDAPDDRPTGIAGVPARTTVLVVGGGPVGLTLRSELGSFDRGRVLWLGVDGGALGQVEAAVRTGLAARGLAPSKSGQRFTPHVTVAKLNPWKAGGLQAVLARAAGAAAAALADTLDAGFVADELQLCAMGGRAQGEYYPVVASVPLAEGGGEQGREGGAGPI